MTTVLWILTCAAAFGPMVYLYHKCTDDHPNEIQSDEIRAWLESGERWQPKNKDGGNGVG